MPQINTNSTRFYERSVIWYLLMNSFVHTQQYVIKCPIFIPIVDYTRDNLSIKCLEDILIFVFCLELYKEWDSNSLILYSYSAK